MLSPSKRSIGHRNFNHFNAKIMILNAFIWLLRFSKALYYVPQRKKCLRIIQKIAKNAVLLKVGLQFDIFHGSVVCLFDSDTFLALETTRSGYVTGVWQIKCLRFCFCSHCFAVSKRPVLFSLPGNLGVNIFNFKVLQEIPAIDGTKAHKVVFSQNFRPHVMTWWQFG
jgi:hypothetical protein